MKTIALLTTLFTTAALHANPVPLELARPDGKPADATKPVKVYLLAGQSNMVGMGDITGARAPYPSVYLSADPAILPGLLSIGTSRKREACSWFWRDRPALRRHGVYQEANGDATGAKVAIFKNLGDPQPAQTATMPLGVVDAEIPAIDGDHTPVAKAFIDVPTTGTYLIHVGFGPSSHAIAKIGDQEVYRKEAGAKARLTKIQLEAGKRHPLEITYLQGGSAALWLEQVDLVGVGDLVTLTGKDGKFPYLVDNKGEWTVRQDVYFHDARIEKKEGSLLSATSNGGSLGPEVGFGWVMGTHHDAPVLLIKTAMGNRALAYDFRPPSSGRAEPASEWEGLEYKLMVEGVRETLAKLDQIMPGYQGQGYEIAGFGWFQGHKDGGASKEEYEGHLVNLIQDLRKDLKAPDMKAVVATVGFSGYRILSGEYKGIWEAQMAVSDPKQHPEFAGNVASVDTRDFWRELEESPRNQSYHYHRNPEFYLLTGEAMSRAMVRLLGGEAAEIPKSDREEKTLAAMKAEAADTDPDEARIAASIAATKPMILDGLMQAYLNHPKKAKHVTSDFTAPKPQPEMMPDYLEDSVDDIVAFHQEAGIDTYDWKPVVPGMNTAEWQIFSVEISNNPYEVDMPAKNVSKKGGKKSKPEPLAIQLPKGQENWFAADFDAAKAGWKMAPAPFGKTVPKDWPENLAWIVKYPSYPAERPQPTTVIDHDVVLMRGSFDLPPAQPGHRYRIRIDGSINANSGEAFAIYVNGKLMSEESMGVTNWRRSGLRGSHVWQDFTDAFKGGPVTLAIAHFPMVNWKSGDWVPAIGPLSVWIESQKVPDLNTIQTSSAAP